MQLLKCSLATSDEIVKLQEEGLGVIIDKATMEQDEVIHVRKCFTAFIKNDIRNVDPNIFKYVRDPECDADLYESNYNKSMEVSMKKIAFKYSPYRENLQMSAETNPTQGNTIAYLLQKSSIRDFNI